MPGPLAAATLDDVRRRLAAGQQVDVVSPDPSGAALHADLHTPASALKLLRVAAGAAEVELRFEEPYPFAGGGRRAQAGRAVLGLILRRARAGTVHLAGDAEVDSGWARLVLGPAGTVVVESEAAASALASAGVAPSRITVRPAVPENDDDAAPAAAPAGDVARQPWRLGPDATHAEIQAEVRRRAAARRSTESAAVVLNAGWGVDATTALRAVPFLGPAPIRSTKPGVPALKKAIRRVTGWQVDPVMEHVNRLHRAVLVAIEAQSRRER
jgi:hypothetical protein